MIFQKCKIRKSWILVKQAPRNRTVYFFHNTKTPSRYACSMVRTTFRSFRYSSFDTSSRWFRVTWCSSCLLLLKRIFLEQSWQPNNVFLDLVSDSTRWMVITGSYPFMLKTSCWRFSWNLISLEGMRILFFIVKHHLKKIFFEIFLLFIFRHETLCEI